MMAIRTPPQGWIDAPHGFRLYCQSLYASGHVIEFGANQPIVERDTFDKAEMDADAIFFDGYTLAKYRRFGKEQSLANEGLMCDSAVALSEFTIDKPCDRCGGEVAPRAIVAVSHYEANDKIHWCGSCELAMEE